MDFVNTFLNAEVILRVYPMLLKGIGNTVALATTTIVVGGIAGVLICLVRLYAPKFFRGLAIAYVDLFRAIPILVLLVIIYYALPFMGIRLNAFMATTLALGLVFSSFTADGSCSCTWPIVPSHNLESDLATGISDRDPTTYIECSRDCQGHLTCIRRSDARSAEASH